MFYNVQNNVKMTLCCSNIKLSMYKSHETEHTYMPDFTYFFTQPKSKYKRAVFCQNQTHILPSEQLVVFLAEGRLRLPRWFFSCSTSLTHTVLMIKTRCDF